MIPCLARFLTALLLVLVAQPTVHAQAPLNARMKDFRRDVADDSGRRSRLTGKDAAHLGDGIFQITGPHVETFRADGTVDMAIDAAEALFDNNKSREVWGEKDLSMKTGDQRIALTGVGFRWRPAAGLLIVSNKVAAAIRREAVVATAPANAEPMTVNADYMEHRTEAVLFRGNVHVIDAQGELRCQELNVRFDQNNALEQVEAIDRVILTQGQTEARGNRGLFTPSSGLLRLTGQTTWRTGDRMGESETLILHRTNNTIRAETKVRMTLPSTMIATPETPDSPPKSGANQVTIAADTFDYAPTNSATLGPIAIYNGNVHAVEPQAALDCELLTIYFDRDNRLSRGVAERSVKILRADGQIEGSRAVFENDEITVTGNPRWDLQKKVGSSKTLVFNPRTREARALENVRMEIPFTGSASFSLLSPASEPPGPATATNILVITSENFTNVNNVATFSGGVRANETRGQIDANLLSVHFGASNRVERIVASGDVILTEAKMQAIGQRADYELASERIRVTGLPKVFADGREIIARELLVDRASGTIRWLPPFRIEVRGKGAKPSTSPAP